MFAKHVTEIQKTRVLLNNAQESKTRLAQLVCDGLDLVATRSAEFDTAVPHEYPFKKHFLELLTSLHNVEDGIFLELFEDLALFSRIRALKWGMDALTRQETAILEYFENSGEWRRDDRSLVTESYWYELPETLRAE